MNIANTTSTIRRRLLLGLLCATLLSTLGAGAMLYHSLRAEANELADLQLRQLAVALPDEFAPRTGMPAPEDPEEEFAIQAWNQDGKQVYAARLKPHPLMPQQNVSGFATLHFQGESWRVYGVRRHDLYVQAAQPMAARDQLAASMALRAGAPLVAFVVLLLVLVLLVVRDALRPLNRLAHMLADRSPSTLEPLRVDGWPVELTPIVHALNAFLEKFAQTLVAQRVFVADAAHELRSPLTALKLQLQLAERETSDAARAAAMARLHRRLDRTSHLVNQMLSLATHETGHTAAQMTQLELASLLPDVAADHSTLADSRGIDLGVEIEAPLHLLAHRDGLVVILNNLIDNALRYTPQGGQVDVIARSENGRAVLQVQDNGPGVPAAGRERLFDRFFRPEGNEAGGCGLGLSIVRQIAEHHGAEVELHDGPAGRGLAVKLTFPASATIGGVAN
ncbi:MAG: ATP-binding protein [Pseudomonadota bacterium]